jgi:hypothetical protein
VDAFGDAHRVWNHLWQELERLVVEIDAALGAHLRERPIRARRDPRPGRGALVVGRACLRFELDVDDRAVPAVLGTAERVLRLTAFSAGRTGEPSPIAVVWIDSTTERWTSSETEGEILRLDDRPALERLFLSLLVDAA